jgi:hypothetical protein
MTVKEKAKELIEKFEEYADYKECDVFTERQRMRINAIHISLIAVDEVINYINRMNQNFNLNLSTSDWYCVKKEIRNYE